MTEIVVYKTSVSILNIEIQITFRHRMRLKYMCNYLYATSYLAGVIYQDKSVVAYLRPFCGDAMKIASL